MISSKKMKWNSYVIEEKVIEESLSSNSISQKSVSISDSCSSDERVISQEPLKFHKRQSTLKLCVPIKKRQRGQSLPNDL